MNNIVNAKHKDIADIKTIEDIDNLANEFMVIKTEKRRHIDPFLSPGVEKAIIEIAIAYEVCVHPNNPSILEACNIMIFSVEQWKNFADNIEKLSDSNISRFTKEKYRIFTLYLKNLRYEQEDICERVKRYLFNTGKVYRVKLTFEYLTIAKGMIFPTSKLVYAENRADAIETAIDALISENFNKRINNIKVVSCEVKTKY